MSTAAIPRGTEVTARQPRKVPRRGSSLRRTPSQPRSVNLVQRVLDATAQVLADVGLEAMSTNKVAAQARVAIGSIYQYFPNKEALLEALIDDRVQRLEALATERMATLSTQSFTTATEAMLRATIDFCSAEPELASILFTRTAAPSGNQRHDASIKKVHDVTCTYLLTCGDRLTMKDVDLVATISTQVIGRFAPWIALSVNVEDHEKYITEVVRMLSLWVGCAAQAEA